MTPETHSCDLCGGREFEMIGTRARDGRPLETQICRTCGLVSHARIPSETELREYYAGNYRLEYNGEASPSARRVMRAWLNGQRILRQVSPLLPAGGRVLEAGAGIGCTVRSFADAGFRAEGVDPGGEFLGFARNRLKADVQVCSLYDLPDSHRFDAVLLVHVIEHLASPRQAVEKISGLLKVGGMLYVECPNLQAPFAPRDRLFHVAHIHNFVPATLKMLVESCGFRLRQRFGDAGDSNLQMLFQHSCERRLNLDTQNFQRTREDLNRASWARYHLRRRYVADRLRKLGSYAREYATSASFVRNLVTRYAADGVRGSQGENTDGESRAALQLRRTA